jgi:hypothetical protein
MTLLLVVDSSDVITTPPSEQAREKAGAWGPFRI